MFRYTCGCFMNIDRRGTGIGKYCDKCKYDQTKDREIYTGLKHVEATHGLRRDANEPSENKKIRGKTI